MTARKRDDQINLLPQKGFEQTTGGRVLVWILSTFRIIVIVTEIIVMIAFLSRFWLDAQNTDLSEEIQQKQSVLAASQNFEKEFKDTQGKLSIYSEIAKGRGVFSNPLQTITSYLPQDLYLTSVRISDNTVEIEGTSPNERSIQQLSVNLNASEIFTEIEIVEIVTSGADPSLLNFKLSTTLKGEN